MNRFVTIVLILLLLCSRMAWAFDTHAVLFFGDAPEWSVSDHNKQQLAEEGDHCCHNTAHFIGIPVSASVNFILPAGLKAVNRENDPDLSRVIPPLTQPPII